MLLLLVVVLLLLLLLQFLLLLWLLQGVRIPAGSPRLSNPSQVAVNCRNPTQDMQIASGDHAAKNVEDIDLAHFEVQ